MRTFKMLISCRLLNTEVRITATVVVVVRDCTRRHKTGAEAELLLVLVLAAGVPGQPLLVELDDHLGTLHVGLPRRHQVRLVTPLPLDQEHQLPAANICNLQKYAQIPNTPTCCPSLR